MDSNFTCAYKIIHKIIPLFSVLFVCLFFASDLYCFHFTIILFLDCDSQSSVLFTDSAVSESVCLGDDGRKRQEKRWMAKRNKGYLKRAYFYISYKH